MKKIFALALAALAALVSCQNDICSPEPQDQPKIVFELTASYSDNAPATKAVKTGWEAGDEIYVYFDRFARTDKRLRMRYDGSSWTTIEMDGDTENVPLGLSEGDRGTMRALCFTGLGYYLTDDLVYEVKQSKVSGAFNMTIPDGFVQFWVAEDRIFVEGSLPDMWLDLACVKSREATGVDESLNVTYTDGVRGGGLAGHLYKRGWLFSGVLDDDYLNKCNGNFYFGLYEYGPGGSKIRKDYFAPGKTLESHSSVVLPPLASPSWVEVGPGKTVELTKDGISYGEWQTCNHGGEYPEDPGTIYGFEAANNLGLILPSSDQWLSLVMNTKEPDKKLNYAYTVVGIGIEGTVFWGDSGFIFLRYPAPRVKNDDGHYWSSTPGKAALFNSYSKEIYSEEDPTRQFMVRALKSPTAPLFNGLNPIEAYY